MTARESLRQRNLRMANAFMDRLGVSEDDRRREVVLEAVNKVRQVYRREDVAAWWRRGWLRLAERTLFQSRHGVDGSDWITWYRDDVDRKIGALRHFKAMPVPELQELRFDRGWVKQLQNRVEAEGGDSIDATLQGMYDIEDQWRDNLGADRRVQDPDAEPILWVDNEWAWFDLHRPACNDEAEAMGHCGNGNGSDDCTLLSFRRVLDRENATYEPHLTFVLDAIEDTSADSHVGVLGEMKGRGNAKPAARYHEAIVSLLCDRHPQDAERFRVQGLRGGDYYPENDFAVNQLAPEKRETLFSKRPDLKPFARQIDDGADPMTVGRRVLERLDDKELTSANVTTFFVESPDRLARWTRQIGKLPLAVFDDVGEFLDEHGDEQTAECAKEYLDAEISEIDQDEIEEAMDTLEIPLNRIRSLLGVENGSQEAADEPAYAAEIYGHDKSSLRASLERTKTGEAVFDAIGKAVSQEREKRYAQHILRAVKDADGFHVSGIDGGEIATLEDKVVLALPLREAAQIYDEQIEHLNTPDLSLSEGIISEVMSENKPDIVQCYDEPLQDAGLLQQAFDDIIETYLDRLEQTLPELTPSASMAM